MKRLIISATSDNLMDKNELLTNLKLLDKKLCEHGIRGDIDMFGGAVMCLGLNARQATHDIDAIFDPKGTMQKLVKEVANEQGLPEDWLNDSVKGFVSDSGEFIRFGEDIFTNLTVFMTSPEYLLAMKCLSCRMLSDSSTELSDIKFLINYLNLKNVDEVEELILRYYPASRYQPKTHYMLVELFDSMT